MTLRSSVHRSAILIVGTFLASAAHATDTALVSGKQLKVVVRSSAGVSSDYFTLGDIAEITPSPDKSKASALLAETVVGRAALPGSTRLVNKGDILLKLREAGIDPSTVDLEGATSVYITTAGSSGTGLDGSAPSEAKPQPITVKAGTTVDVVLIDGPVSLRAKATALSSGAVGDKIDVRREGSLHSLAATVIDATTVRLEE